MAKKSLVPQVYKKEDPMAALVARAFEGIVKPPPPNFDPHGGLINRLGQLLKLEDIAKASEHEKTIATNRSIVTKKTIKDATSLMMLPLRLEAERDQIRHERKMRKHDRKIKKLEAESKKYDVLLKEVEAKRSAAELAHFLKGIGSESAEN